MKEITKISLVGKIDGKEDYDETFLAYEKYYTSMQVKIFNPARKVPKGIPYEEKMAICLSKIKFGDMSIVMPNWEDSNGARREVDLAIRLKKDICFIMPLQHKKILAEYGIIGNP